MRRPRELVLVWSLFLAFLAIVVVAMRSPTSAMNLRHDVDQLDERVRKLEEAKR